LSESDRVTRHLAHSHTGTTTSTPKRAVWNLVRRNRERSSMDPMLSSAVLRLADSE
jgi:hypothetical protein